MKGSGGANKQTARENLCQLTKSMANAVFAYATEIGDGDLKAKAKYSISEIRDIKDENLPSTSKGIHDLAKPLAAELAAYGIVTQDFPDLIDAITLYTGAIPSTTTTKVHKKTATINLNTLFKNADDVLKTIMDTTIDKFKKNHPDFVIDYFNSRLIINSATTHTTVRGIIFDAITSEPIPNAQFLLTQIGDKVKTDAKGRFAYKIVKPGTYTGIASATGYTDQQIENIEIKLGKVTTLKIKLTTT